MPEITLQVNGREHRAPDADHHTTLLQYLRAAGLTGTKEGCAEGDCGACTVAILEPGAGGRRHYHAVNACLTLLAAAHHADVWTAEGIGSPDAPHPAQRALAERGGSQCGYCTPGIAMSLFAEYYRDDRDAPDEHALVGNLCRCTGYRPIRDALRALDAPPENDAFLERAREARAEPAAPPLPAYHRPTGLRDAARLLLEHDDARLIAGGTDLGVDIGALGRRVPRLVSVAAIPELLELRDDADAATIGASVTISRVERELRGRVPLLDGLWPWFASRQVRNRATLGGNLGTASPIGDAVTALLALDARVIIAGPDADRELPLEDFITGYRRTALERGELIRAVRVPHPARPERRTSRLYKVAKRGFDDISTVIAAFVIDEDERGRVQRARLAYGGVAATPARAPAAERALEGRPFDRDAVNAAKRALETTFQPIDDLRGSAAYRRALIPNLLEKLWVERQEATVPA